MPYLSMQENVSDGTLQSVLFTIPFLDKGHLRFYIGAEEVTTTSPVGDVLVQSVTNTEVRFTAPVPAGKLVRTLRMTPRTTVPHIFNTGATQFTAATVDANNQNLLYVVQESYEQGGLGPFPPAEEPIQGTEIVTIMQAGAPRECTVLQLLGAVDGNVALLEGMGTWDSAAYINTLP